VAIARATRDALAAGLSRIRQDVGKGRLARPGSLHDGEQVRCGSSLALEAAGRVAASIPDRAATEIRKAKRGGRVYIDVLQNARGHHAVPPYVVRAKPRATVSTPLTWRDLTETLEPADYGTRSVPRRIVRQERDPLAPLLDEAPAQPGRSTRRATT
jgi:bifunctional non-homologous end joining protein LigD